MDSKIVQELRSICGADYVMDQPENVQAYLYDETEIFVRPQASDGCVVVKPGTPQEISKILELANKEKTIVVPRGGGTGLCGAAIPVHPSIILSMERFKKILELDRDNAFVTVEAGVTLGEMTQYLKEAGGLYFPCHPGDESAHMAGLVAENAGGARAIKHGIMRNHIKGIEMVLPTGEIVNFGGKLMKNNAGYDILHLIIGSEGTLGIITKVILKVYPVAESTGTLLISFEDCHTAVESAIKVLQEGIIPLAIEYLDRDIALCSAQHLGLKWPAANGKVDLLFILSETSEEAMYTAAEAIEGICSDNGAVESLIAETASEQQNIMTIRSNTYTAVKNIIMDSLDITVPIAFMPTLMDNFASIAKKHGALINTVGHVGDGNVHNNIYLVDGKVPDYYRQMKEELYAMALANGGTVTGEHGIGKTRNQHLSLQYGKVELELMGKIKDLFDPNAILNPGTGI